MASTTPSCVSDKQHHPNDVDVNMIKTRNIILSFIDRCGIPWPKVVHDAHFEALCHADASRRGFPMEGPNSFVGFLHMGSMMSITGYAHLASTSTRVWIAVYTAGMIYVDDVFQRDVNLVREFRQRFILQQPQLDPVLDCVATILVETPDYYGPVGADLINMAALNLVTAASLDYETQGMPIQAVSYRYPEFSRTLSGVTAAYAVFTFPPELELSTFVQAIPEMIVFINYVNDLLSFHKEEIVGEDVNYVSLLSKQQACSKHEALSRIVDEVVDTHNRTLQILKLHPEALEAYNKFAVGYLGFHAGLSRYKLDALRLDESI